MSEQSMNEVKSFKNTINGIFILDKPVGLSSNQVLQKVKKIFQVKKAGHTGNLDVLASGLLPICLGEATKFSQFLLQADKSYWVVAKLGEKTTTGDTEGEVIETKPVKPFDEATLETVLNQFRGSIQQVPSMFSALKYQGQPLYKLARKGIEVERQPRTVTIYELTVVNFSDDTLTLFVRSSKGTYIRNLVEDIGDQLGCGAHVLSLRRLSVGPYEAAQMMTLQALSDLSESENLQALNAHVLPIESMFSELPRLNLSFSQAKILKVGRTLSLLKPHANGLVCLIETPDYFFGMGEIVDRHRVLPKRLIKCVSEKE